MIADPVIAMTTVDHETALMTADPEMIVVLEMTAVLEMTEVPGMTAAVMMVKGGNPLMKVHLGVIVKGKESSNGHLGETMIVDLIEEMIVGHLCDVMTAEMIAVMIEMTVAAVAEAGEVHPEMTADRPCDVMIAAATTAAMMVASDVAAAVTAEAE